MSNFILLTVLILLFVISYCITKDFFSPACIVCESFLLGYFCSMCSSRLGGWTFALEYNTVLIFCLGLTAYCTACYLALIMTKKRRFDKSQIKIAYLNINGRVINLLFVFQVIYFLIYLFFWLNAVRQFAGLNWSALVYAYRIATRYGEGTESTIPFLVLQFRKISCAATYVSMYIILHDYAVSKINKIKLKFSGKYIKSSIVILLYLLLPILQGSRSEIIKTMIAGMMIWYVIYRYYSSAVNRKNKNTKKAIISVSCVILFAMFLMIFLSDFLGRTSGSFILSPVIDYLGRNMQAFNELIKSYDYTSDAHLMGGYTFAALYDDLQQIGLISGKYEFAVPEIFTQINGVSLGNTYTAFKNAYLDYGLLGVCVIPFIEGYILTAVYKKLYYRTKDRFDLLLMMYAMMIHSAFFYVIAFFFFTLFAVNYLIIFVLLYCMCSLLNGDIFVDGFSIIVKKRFKQAEQTHKQTFS